MVGWDHWSWMVNLHHHSWVEDGYCHIISHLILDCDCAAALQLWCILVLILTRTNCIIVIFLENLQIACLDCLTPHVLNMPP